LLWNSGNLLADENSGRTVQFALRLQLKAFSLCGEPILEVGFQGNARLTSREIISSDVFAYGEPDENPGQPEALLEIFLLSETTDKLLSFGGGMRVNLCSAKR
jgi:hypothetical protein